MLLLHGCDDTAPVEQELAGTPAVAVAVEVLQPRPWQGLVISHGELEATEEVDLSVDFTGVVASLPVAEGQEVKAGDLLLELDREKRQFRLQQAEEAVAQASAGLNEARLMLERRQRLAEQETISREALDNARLSVDAAAARYREAIAARQLAARELAESRLFSPVDGVVDRIPVEIGEAVLAGTLLMQVHSLGALKVRSWVSEADINYVQPGAEATIELPALPGRVLTAVVESVGVNADSATGNFLVKLVLPAEPDLRPGLTVRVKLAGLEWPDALVLPEAALVDRDRQRVVFVEEAGHARQRIPLLGAGLADKLLVYDGLQPGERVIVSGLEALIDGSPVVVVSE